MTPYAELVAATNFSFLRGASHAQEMVGQAAELGLAAIGIADRNTLAGVVRAHRAAREHKIRLLVGARLVTTDGFEAACYPTDRKAYGRLCRLLTAGNRRAIKGQCHFSFEEMIAASEGQIFIALPPRRITPDFAERLATLPAAARGRVHLGATFAYDGTERRRLGELDELARQARAPLVATNDAHYHHPGRKPLADVLACIREKCTIAEAGYRLEANAERHLKSGRRDGAPVRALPAGRGPHARDRRPHHLQPRGAALRVPRRAGAAGQDPAGLSGGADLGARHQALPRRRPRQGARAPRQGAGADRTARLRALFPHRLRRRALRPRAGQADPVPGPRLGRQQRGVLLPRHHLRRSDRDRPAVRALHLGRPRRAARHRRRLRARAARGGDPVPLFPLRPRARRHLLDRDPLPPAHGDPRGGQGPGPQGGRDRGACRPDLGRGRRRDPRQAHHARPGSIPPTPRSARRSGSPASCWASRAISPSTSAASC